MTVLLAQADASPVFLQYGAIGAVALLASWWAWTMYKRETANSDRERERADRLETELRQLHESIHERYIPTLTNLTSELQRFLRVTRGEDP
jgi:hypothetical protein